MLPMGRVVCGHLGGFDHRVLLSCWLDINRSTVIFKDIHLWFHLFRKTWRCIVNSREYQLRCKWGLSIVIESRCKVFARCSLALYLQSLLAFRLVSTFSYGVLNSLFATYESRLLLFTNALCSGDIAALHALTHRRLRSLGVMFWSSKENESLLASDIKRNDLKGCTISVWVIGIILGAKEHSLWVLIYQCINYSEWWENKTNQKEKIVYKTNTSKDRTLTIIYSGTL